MPSGHWLVRIQSLWLVFPRMVRLLRWFTGEIGLRRIRQAFVRLVVSGYCECRDKIYRIDKKGDKNKRRERRWKSKGSEGFPMTRGVGVNSLAVEGWVGGEGGGINVSLCPAVVPKLPRGLRPRYKPQTLNH